MNEELSRVKSRRKSADRQSRPPAGASKAQPVRATATTEVYQEQGVKASGGLSRKARYAAKGSAKTDSQQLNTAQDGETPSRSESYSSERVRWSKIFVNTLSVLFILLLGFLVWWGIEDAPDLRTLW
ncbi:hypothetical protein NST84_19610 [Paenibacillus sp. FSL R7-0345]|uniref:hypothetical protein n=1 Tax=Paenibacillus sp. FSL R7-0345 TaxID=2954535 RepID=UPI00315A4501